MKKMLLADVQGIQDERRYYRPLFNAGQYLPLEKELFSFFQDNEAPFATLMHNSYVRYDYFAFTALGCDVEDRTQENGNIYQSPKGPVIPKRIEEPLLWLLYQLGYIGTNAALPGDVCCPNCGSINESYELMGDERFIKVKKKNGLLGHLGFKSDTIKVNRCCKACEYKWYYVQK